MRSFKTHILLYFRNNHLKFDAEVVFISFVVSIECGLVSVGWAHL